MNKPLISIITVVFNARLTLEATIQSVLDQDKELAEYWIIDGGSTDGTVEIIRQYEDQLSGWCSEPDKGIYDAMNKGIDLANGEWIYFLGSDDKLKSDIVKQIQPYLNSNYSIVFGDVVFDNSHRMRSFLGFRTLLQNTLHHQSAFYNQSIFRSFRYDTSLTILADYELNLRVYLQKLPVHYVPILIACCATGGASAQLTNSRLETNKVRARYIKNTWLNTLLSTVLRIYYIQKQFRFQLYGHRV